MDNIRTINLLRMFLTLVALLLVVAACSETEPELVDDNDGQASDEGNENGEASAAESEEDLEEAEGFTVGDTVRMGELVMTLHSVRWDEGGEFSGPDEGMNWLVADIEIENESESSTSISSLIMFDLVDEESRTRDLAIMADTEGSLDGELGSGRNLRGDIAWEVREEQQAWELIFNPELFGFGQAIFDVTAEDL